MPSARVLDCFVKKLTVMGIMGKTHGVNSAANPKPNPSKNVQKSPFFAFLLAFLRRATFPKHAASSGLALRHRVLRRSGRTNVAARDNNWPTLGLRLDRLRH